MSIFTDNKHILLGMIGCYASEYDILKGGTVVSLKEDGKVVGRFADCEWKQEGNELKFISHYIPAEPIQRVTFTGFIIDPNTLNNEQQ